MWKFFKVGLLSLPRRQVSRWRHQYWINYWLPQWCNIAGAENGLRPMLDKIHTSPISFTNISLTVLLLQTPSLLSTPAGTRGAVVKCTTPAIISSSGPSRTRSRCETTRGTTFAASTSDTSQLSRGFTCNQSASVPDASDCERSDVVEGPIVAHCKCTLPS